MKDDSSPIEFPTEMSLKIFGKSSEQFERSVLATIEENVTELKENAFQYKHSKNKAYLSITATAKFNNREQWAGLYEKLNALPEVIMVL